MSGNSTDSIVPESIADCAPAPKLVYVALAEDGPLRATEIAASTTLPRSTVQDALRTLVEAGVVRASPNYPDTRQRVYRITAD